MSVLHMPIMQSAAAEVAVAATDERNWVLWTAFKTGQVLLFVLSLALLVAALVLADRKIWAAVQMRQTIADALKFFFKEIVIPAGSDKFLFILAPILGLIMAFAAWAVVPVAPGWVISDINIGVLYVLAKYPFMGALRSAAQMVSYEVSIGFIILTVIFLSGSMNLTTIVDTQGAGFWQGSGIGICSASTHQGNLALRTGWLRRSCFIWASCSLSRHWQKRTVRHLIYLKRNLNWLRGIRLSILLRHSLCSSLRNM